MNTVFKFYLQAWVLFAIACAAALPLMFERLMPARVPSSPNSRASAPESLPGESISQSTRAPSSFRLNWKPLWWAVFAILISFGMLYPVLATWAKVNDRYVPSSASGLNGMDYMLGASYGENGQDFELAPDHEAILWLRENVQGSPVIAEANTGLYHWGNRISINTGLPTIIGWDWHTKQQYSLIDGAIIDHRIEDLRSLYDGTDSSQALAILKRYNVAYIYVGPLERAVYSAVGLAKFDSMTNGGILTRVYDSNGVQIYRVNLQLAAVGP